MSPEKKDPYKEGYAGIYGPGQQPVEETDPAVAQKIRDEKLKTIGQICGAIDHWIRTPLAGITSALAIIEMEEDKLSSEAKRCIGDIDKKVSAIDSILQRIKEMAKPGEVQLEQVEVGQLVENALLLAGYEVSTRKIRVEKDLGTKDTVIRGSRIQLEQVLYQIIKNACEAIGHDGMVAIRTQKGPDKNQVQIHVTDTGPGIPKELLKGTMGMFYSTKNAGVGMGLFISNLVIQAHSGKLSVDSDKGRGATFTITLPTQ